MISQAVKNIGKYEILEVVGRGGMGVVYKALDSRMDRLVAIKMMTAGVSEDPDLLKRFYREAKSTGMLQHPGIVIVYDLGEDNGSPYLVMEYLEGQPLSQAMASGVQFSTLDKLGIMIQVCDALHYAHGRGVVHRDVKPANVMLLKDGNVKLVDFGIARIADHTLTQTGHVVGTVSYMSPEQIKGYVVDARSDIFSAGVLFYQLLTGHLPFQGHDPTSTLMKIVQEPPPPLRTYIPECPAELEEIVQRALAKEREERYQTAEDFAFDLSRMQESSRRGMAADFIARARASIGQSDFAKAKDLLHQVLKADSQHTVAKQLIHEVQARLQQQQREEKIAQLRFSAEHAQREHLFAEALLLIQQALELSKSDPELLKLQHEIQEAKALKERLDELTRTAGLALDAGNFETATRLLKEALTLDPQNPQISSMLNQASKALAEEDKQKRLRNLLDEARKNIAARKLPDAFALLRQAESLDAASPELQAVKGIALSVQQQEARREELDRSIREVQEALHREDFLNASSLAEAALQKFPGDAGLLKLKGLADKQREADEKRRFVEEQLSAARRLLDSGQAFEASALLRQALEKVPGIARLQSLLALVGESLDHQKKEQVKADYIQRAKTAIQNKQFDGALKILDAAQAEVEDAPEIQDLLQFVREEAAIAAHREKIETAAAEAQRLTAQEDFEPAIALLEAALNETPSEELRGLLQEVRRTAEAFNAKIESIAARAQRLLALQRVEEAISLLESQPESYARSLTFRKALESCREEKARLENIQKALSGSQAATQKGDFDSALEILKACLATYGDHPAISSSLKDVQKKRCLAAKSAVEKAIRECRSLLLSGKYETVLKTLESVARLLDDTPPELQNQYNALAKDAKSGMARQQRDSELSHSLAEKSKAAADTVIAGSYEPTIGLKAVSSPTPVRSVQPAMIAGPSADGNVAAARKKLMVRLAVALTLLILVGFVGYKLQRRRTAVPQASTYVEVNAVPWATVVSISSVDGKSSFDVKKLTPLRIPLSPGEYVINLSGPAGDLKSRKIQVSDNLPGSYTEVFEPIDVDEILKSH